MPCLACDSLSGQPSSAGPHAGLTFDRDVDDDSCGESDPGEHYSCECGALLYRHTGNLDSKVWSFRATTEERRAGHAVHLAALREATKAKVIVYRDSMTEFQEVTPPIDGAWLEELPGFTKATPKRPRCRYRAWVAWSNNPELIRHFPAVDALLDRVESKSTLDAGASSVFWVDTLDEKTAAFIIGDAGEEKRGYGFVRATTIVSLG